MKRRSRVALSALAVAGSVALVLGLIGLGSASEGPLTSTLRALTSAIGTLESRLVRRVRGPGRAAQLAWLEPLRTQPEALRHPDTLLVGAYDPEVQTDLSGVLRLEQTLGTSMALVQLYAAWGDAPTQAFPRRQVEAIAEIGSIPVITWEPWLTAFENSLHPDLPLRGARDRGGLAQIAKGTYDFYLDAWAADAARFGRPILLRFAHEMNDPYRYPWGPQNNPPQDFIAAWRHLADRFRKAGAINVLWVWSPHVAYAGYEVYWPGPEYVDWVATGALNYGTVAYWSRWWTFEEIFGRHYDFLRGFGKPLMVAEFGSLAVGGDRAAWYRDALHDLGARFPAVRALIFFDVRADATITQQALDWSILEDSAVVARVREAIVAAGGDPGQKSQRERATGVR